MCPLCKSENIKRFSIFTYLENFEYSAECEECHITFKPNFEEIHISDFLNFTRINLSSLSEKPARRGQDDDS